jgi:hypothetical protein
MPARREHLKRELQRGRRRNMEHMFILPTLDLQQLKSSKMHLTLPHLYKDPVYLETYKRWKKEGDFIMQDNSIFELKDVVAGDLLDFGRQIGADEIMVPESLRNMEVCVALTDRFCCKLSPADQNQFRLAACLQGKTWEEVAEHYRILDSEYGRFIDTICIPFGLEFDCYNTENEMWMHSGWNRFSNVWRLVREGIWNPARDHHLLGLHNPAELALYEQSGLFNEAVLKSIRSNDSSICYRYGQYGAHFYLSEGLLYKKIKGQLDFNSHYTSPEQFVMFERNKALLRLFLEGKGGEALWQSYVSNASTYEYSLAREFK